MVYSVEVVKDNDGFAQTDDQIDSVVADGHDSGRSEEFSCSSYTLEQPENGITFHSSEH